MKGLNLNIEGLERKNKTQFMRKKAAVNKYNQEKICFISPRKIAFFKDIDMSCLDDKEKEGIKKNCQSEIKLKGDKNDGQRQIIDYKSIKNCLSPRANKFHYKQLSIFEQPVQLLPSSDQKISNQSNQQEKGIQNHQKQLIIENLQKQLIAFSAKVRSLQAEIQQKDLKILEYEQKLQESSTKIKKYEKQSNDNHNVSIKSISTNHSEQQSFDLLQKKHNFYEFVSQNSQENIEEYKKIISMNEQKEKSYKEKINKYEQLINKYKIKVDITNKIKFDITRTEKQRNKLWRNNEKYRRQIEDLKSKNIRLRREMMMKADQQIYLEYSPDKRRENNQCEGLI